MTAERTSRGHQTQRALSQDDVVNYLEGAHDGILIVDDEGFICYANAAARTMLGRESDEEVIGGLFGRPLAVAGYQRLEIYAPSGPLPIDVRVSPVQRGKQMGWVLSMRPGDEMAGDSIAITYHELRNQLTAMTAAVETLHLDWETMGVERRQSYLQLMQRKIERMALTMDGYLQAARAREGMFTRREEVVSVLDVVLDYVHVLGPLAREVEIEIEDEVTVTAGVDHVQSIIDNFVGNAFKYAGGSVTISATSRDDWTSIEVSDRGPGVPSERQSTLFDRFVRVDNVSTVNGTGLGLWIARSIAEAYGGSTGYAEREGGGSTFWALLPSAAASA